MIEVNIKYCQSCIQRGFNPPNPATREWQTNVFYCEECFNALLQNLQGIAPAEVQSAVEDIKELELLKLPWLDTIYQVLNVPKELQFDKVDIVCRNRDKIFNFHAPSVINRTLEDLEMEVEQLGMVLFQVKYRMEPLQGRISQLKEELRKERNLTSYKDSKEVYAKSPKKSAVKVTQEEKMAKTLGMSLEEYRKTVADAQVKDKAAKERKFNILAGNCPDCGGAMPCSTHK
jgi:hypothetical protein